MLVAQSCPPLCDLMDFSLTGSYVHGILQARILEGLAIPFSRGTSQPRDWIHVSHVAGRFFTIWATREAPPRKWNLSLFSLLPHLFAMKWWDKMPWSSSFDCSVLSQVFHFLLLPSIRGSLSPHHFLRLVWYHLHIWGCWYFSQDYWFQLVLHWALHFTRCTLHRS